MNEFTLFSAYFPLPSFIQVVLKTISQEICYFSILSLPSLALAELKRYCDFRKTAPIDRPFACISMRLSESQSKIFAGKTALEIAGPSKTFQHDEIVPIYPLLARVDDLSFPRPESWGGRRLIPGSEYVYSESHKPGRQFIGDTSKLSEFPDSSYDVVIASHVFEHLANPLKAAREWLRILKNLGVLLLVVPHRDATFDALRSLTTFCHLEEDLVNDTSEDDKTHFDDVRLRSAKGFSDEWFNDCYLHRGLHHHVFDTRLMIEIFVKLRLFIFLLETEIPHHIVIGGIKDKNTNAISSENIAAVLRNSPFPTDRLL